MAVIVSIFILDTDFRIFFLKKQALSKFEFEMAIQKICRMCRF